MTMCLRDPQSPPRVSVIVPAYNAGQWLDRCLRSVLGQEYPSFEVVVVDDGSTDATPSIVAGYAARDGRVKVVRQPNGGLPSARRAGIEHAVGEWIQWLDADDELLPGALEALVARADATGADVVAAPFFWCYADGRRERSAALCFDRLSGTEYFGEILRGRGHWSVWSNFQRRELGLKYVGYFPEIVMGEDCLWMTQLLLNDPAVAALDRPVLNYFVYPTSVSRGGTSSRKKYRDLCFVHEFMRREMARRGLEAHFREELLVQDGQMLYHGLHWGGLSDNVAAGRRAYELLRERPDMSFVFTSRQLRFIAACSGWALRGRLKALFNRISGKTL